MFIWLRLDARLGRNQKSPPLSKPLSTQPNLSEQTGSSFFRETVDPSAGVARTRDDSDKR